MRDRGYRQFLNDAARADSRITILDNTMDRAVMDQLVYDCDIFLSLHRAEGFGFGAAEALAAGKAVVSTDYSGTADFITPETGYPVAYTLQPVKEDAYADWKDQFWAEPDIDDAVRQLRIIEADREAARVKAMTGRRYMEENHSPEAVGSKIREILDSKGLL